jgi:hypothetical protein
LSLAAGKGAEMKWRLLPDCRTPSFLEIWLAPGSPAKALEVTVSPPGGDSRVIAEGEAYTWKPGSDVLCTGVYLERVANGEGRMILLAAGPTQSTTHPGRDLAPAGLWTVKVRNLTTRRIEVDAWIQRNEAVFGGLPYGRQSRFEDPDYEKLDENGRAQEKDNSRSYVRRHATINAIATGQRSIVVGGFRREDGVAALYSGVGSATRDPDAMAASDDTLAMHGVRAAGTRSGSTFAMNGTSVAAPQVARWIAADMAAGGRGDQASVRTEARKQETARQNQPGGSPFPTDPDPDVGGDGRIYIPPVVKSGR